MKYLSASVVQPDVPAIPSENGDTKKLLKHERTQREYMERFSLRPLRLLCDFAVKAP
jgi:hypothetical protein